MAIAFQFRFGGKRMY